MRYLKTFNEEVKFDFEWDPECVRLQGIINKYNDILYEDDVWKKFYHHIPLYYEKQKDSEFLESIIEFAKKRIEDIKNENKELLKDVKNIIHEIEDNVNFIESVKYKDLAENELTFECLVVMKLLPEIVKKRKFEASEYWHNSYEVINLFPHLASASSRLESLGLKVFLSVMPHNPHVTFRLLGNIKYPTPNNL